MLSRRTKAEAMVLAVIVVSCPCFMPFVSGETQHCVDINNDVTYKADDMEGMWYPIEIVLHRNDSKIYGVPLDTQCPVVSFTVSPKNKKILIMVWNATDGDLEYKFQQKGRGQWQAIYDQRGPSQEHLQGLRATVLALDKDKYMIVRLCSTTIHNSVLLSRQNTRSPEVLAVASAELAQMLKYPAYERKPMCNSSAGILGHLSTNVLLASVSLLVLLLRI